jgi:hypothetical protein
MDPGPDSDPNANPDSAIFVSDLQDVNKKLLLFEVRLHHLSKIKSQTEGKNDKRVRINVFLTNFAS